MIDVDPLNPPCAGCHRARGHRLPIHRAFFAGRSDWDWFRSIRKYLEFRAGLAWRPVRHSGTCVTRDYRDALWVLHQAFFLKPGEEAWLTENLRRALGPIESAPPLADANPVPRKPPQNVIVVTKELADAEACG